jgi:methionyl-tRNA formyltransferase
VKQPAQPNRQRIKVGLFASFYRGFFVLDELLRGPASALVEVVGLATDDPAQSFVSPGKRVWQHPHTRYEEIMVSQMAQAVGIPVYAGRVKSPEFYALMETQWQPDICIMGTFGQKIDARLFNYPRLGFFNIHPCAYGIWPTRYPGANPYGEMIDDNVTHLNIALHRVGDDIDTGELMGMSESIPLPKETSVIDLHKLSAPAAAHLVGREIMRIIKQG